MKRKEFIAGAVLTAASGTALANSQRSESLALKKRQHCTQCLFLVEGWNFHN